MTVNAIILEDEPIAKRRLIRLIEQQGILNICITDSFDSLEALKDWISQNETPDILFLDISVTDGNAIQLFQDIRTDAHVIFTTAHDQYAIQAFEIGALDYLLKPISLKTLARSLERIKDRMYSSQKDETPGGSFKNRFLIRFANKLHQLDATDIAYIYSEDKLSFFILSDGRRIASDTPLQEWGKQLNPHLFFRANRQVIVHRQGIHEILRHSRSRLRLILEPMHHEEIVVSTENTPRFKAWLA